MFHSRNLLRMFLLLAAVALIMLALYGITRQGVFFVTAVIFWLLPMQILFSVAAIRAVFFPETNDVAISGCGAAFLFACLLLPPLLGVAIVYLVILI